MTRGLQGEGSQPGSWARESVSRQVSYSRSGMVERRLPYKVATQAQTRVSELQLARNMTQSVKLTTGNLSFLIHKMVQ